jgi:hypothetical protein
MNELFLGQNAKIKEIKLLEIIWHMEGNKTFLIKFFYKSKNVPEIEKFRKNFKNNFFLRLRRKPIATGLVCIKLKNVNLMNLKQIK